MAEENNTLILNEKPNWDINIPKLVRTDSIGGAVEDKQNTQALMIANRTRYLQKALQYLTHLIKTELNDNREDVSFNPIAQLSVFIDTCAKLYEVIKKFSGDASTTVPDTSFLYYPQLMVSNMTELEDVDVKATERAYEVTKISVNPKMKTAANIGGIRWDYSDLLKEKDFDIVITKYNGYELAKNDNNEPIVTVISVQNYDPTNKETIKHYYPEVTGAPARYRIQVQIHDGQLSEGYFTPPEIFSDDKSVSLVSVSTVSNFNAPCNTFEIEFDNGVELHNMINPNNMPFKICAKVGPEQLSNIFSSDDIIYIPNENSVHHMKHQFKIKKHDDGFRNNGVFVSSLQYELVFTNENVFVLKGTGTDSANPYTIVDTLLTVPISINNTSTYALPQVEFAIIERKYDETKYQLQLGFDKLVKTLPLENDNEPEPTLILSDGSTTYEYGLYPITKAYATKTLYFDIKRRLRNTNNWEDSNIIDENSYFSLSCKDNQTSNIFDAATVITDANNDNDYTDSYNIHYFKDMIIYPVNSYSFPRLISAVIDNTDNEDITIRSYLYVTFSKQEDLMNPSINGVDGKFPSLYAFGNNFIIKNEDGSVVHDITIDDTFTTIGPDEGCTALFILNGVVHKNRRLKLCFINDVAEANKVYDSTNNALIADCEVLINTSNAHISFEESFIPKTIGEYNPDNAEPVNMTIDQIKALLEKNESGYLKIGDKIRLEERDFLIADVNTYKDCYNFVNLNNNHILLYDLDGLINKWYPVLNDEHGETIEEFLQRYEETIVHNIINKTTGITRHGEADKKVFLPTVFELAGRNYESKSTGVGPDMYVASNFVFNEAPYYNWIKLFKLIITSKKITDRYKSIGMTNMSENDLMYEDFDILVTTKLFEFMQYANTWTYSVLETKLDNNTKQVILSPVYISSNSNGFPTKHGTALMFEPVSNMVGRRANQVRIHPIVVIN